MPGPHNAKIGSYLTPTLWAELITAYTEVHNHHAGCGLPGRKQDKEPSEVPRFQGSKVLTGDLGKEEGGGRGPGDLGTFGFGTNQQTRSPVAGAFCCCCLVHNNMQLFPLIRGPPF